ncbi:MAG: TonB-dependent receptor [Arcobacter sp.]|nr:MAG: TonB-dependent receptor [Arcobacter sp.]
MKTPKGFGKNYFSLSAICAYSNGVTLQAQCSSFIHLSLNLSFETLEEETAPLEELEILLLETSTKIKTSSCHCNCFFKNLLYTLVQLFKFHPQTFFIFFKTRSGISPPLLRFTLINYILNLGNIMKRTIIFSLLSLMLISDLQAKVIDLQALSIEASSLNNNELNAPESIEIYTSEDINKAHVQTLPEFLQKNTSLNILPAYGNSFSPLLDMRGYGIEHGNANIVIRINGRRINNIDNVPQLLASISPASIERIEISKGSGIVQGGDGANAGVINIITKQNNHKEVSIALGSQNTSNLDVYLGHTNDLISVSLSANMHKTNGTRSIDSNGSTDEKKLTSVVLNFALTPIDDLELRFGVSKTSVDAVYGSYLTLDEYDNDPSQSGATNSGASQQDYKVTVFSTGIGYDINQALDFQIDYSNEKKRSANTYSSGFVDSSRYTYDNVLSSLNYHSGGINLSTGLEAYLGNRDGYGGNIDKDNYAAYILSQYRLDKHTLKIGYRYERAFYEQDQTTTDNKKAYTMHGAELAYNYTFDTQHSTFLSYTRSFQSANIDQLLVYVFPTGGVFQNFLDPMKVDTYTLGYNNIQKDNKFKTSIFYADLKNEFYYYTGPTGTFDPASKNTNIDESSKYGLEFFDAYHINESFNITALYTYVRAKIDKEIENGTDLSGNTLPGVPKHTAKATLNYHPNDNTVLTLLQNYRSKAYALNDTQNNFSQKQERYLSTDISITYTKDNYEVFAKINNLFDQSNGLWISDDAIYPVNFRLNFLTGLKLKF